MISINSITFVEKAETNISTHLLLLNHEASRLHFGDSSFCWMLYLEISTNIRRSHYNTETKSEPKDP